MLITFDPKKSEKNQIERGFSFDLASRFELQHALIKIDFRQNYGELRFNALSPIDSRLYHLTFTVCVDTIRVISFRKANKREVKYYANNH